MGQPFGVPLHHYKGSHVPLRAPAIVLACKESIQAKREYLFILSSDDSPVYSQEKRKQMIEPSFFASVCISEDDSAHIATVGQSMPSAPIHRILRPLLLGTFILGCFVTLFLMYFKPSTSWLSGPVESTVSTDRVKNLFSIKNDKNVTTVLIWLWPFGQTYDLGVCSSLFNIEGCFITADRNLYNKSDGVVIHHRDICTDLSNLPPLQRPSFQKWIWMNLESPSHSSQLPGIENLFNLTLNYRQDADVEVPYGSIVAAEGEEDFVPPSKNKLICWIVSNWNQDHVRVKYYNELYKHIEVHARHFKVKKAYFWAEHTCLACDYLRRHKEYKAFNNLDKWYWGG
ncbi:hypothetical protein FQN60_008789 [Etheostoma spectabile]|uniref:Fucosyltransferase n=1 Tax=Etheostoma spectabile TaxID=54343 RepID=A0A5J5CMH0_9PERO|nr:hypothetical protein FQN60_008789 [Etheostoma spectabile]